MNTDKNPFSLDTALDAMITEHHLDTVILAGHMNPDGDACGSVMGVAHYLHVNYPQLTVLPHLSEALDKGPKKLVKQDPVFDPFPLPQPETEHYGIIVCDTGDVKRIIGREYYDNAEYSIVLDHHAANNGYGDINYTRISESCCENIFQILDPEKLSLAAKQPHPNAADYLYTGILTDTDCFSRAKPTTLQAASRLMELGVDHSWLVRTAIQTMTMEDLNRRSRLLSLAKTAMDGEVAYLVLTMEECEKNGFGYEDIHPISGLLRDCEGIELAFSMFEQEPKVWRCSFRSDGKWINVNELLNPFGGGGHAAAAGLKTPYDDVDELLERVFARIREMRQ